MKSKNIEEREVEVKLKDLPNFSELNKQVQDVINCSSWWELYGIDWVIIGVHFAFLPIGYYLLKSSDILTFTCGFIMLGCAHNVLANKGGHAAAHGSVCRSLAWNKFWSWFLVEFIGSYSLYMAHMIHVKIHHPYTNIIGLGDSSAWRAPFLPCYVYMFFAPLLVPILTPIVSIGQLIAQTNVLRVASYIICLTGGLSVHMFALMYISGFSFIGAFMCLFAYRALFAIPYIHINIFQHIGLPMYSQASKPKRIYQMSTGVLNLSRNKVLDIVFGHSLYYCHIEHHLFPVLSDNMCLKIKPLVKKFLKENGLPYNEDSYKNRLIVFVELYKELMVDVPPITHFVGIQ